LKLTFNFDLQIIFASEGAVKLARAALLSREKGLANQLSCQQRDSQFVMAGDRITLSGAVRGRPPYHVGYWPVGLNEVEVSGGNVG
jgi:hypothetical protein